MKIIILGAAGHVGQNLAYYFSMGAHEVLPYARGNRRGFLPLENFADAPDADILVNCIGVGTPAKEAEIGAELDFVENMWDNECLNYLKYHNNTAYIYFSSGVANPKYWNDSTYCKTKVKMENKHLSLPLPIWNIRLYSFFSRYINRENTQLLPSIIHAIQNKEVLQVTGQDIVRDYIHPMNLASLIEDTFICEYPNRIIDVGSRKPIMKSEILSYFKDRYGLKYEYVETETVDKKPNYVPFFQDPCFLTSLESLDREAGVLLGGE